jgi:Replication-relaxation
MNHHNPKDKPNGSGMVLTSRDQHIVTLISKQGALTRAQIMRVVGFGSVARTNAVLLRLVRHNYLGVRTQATLRGRARHVYTLGPRGAELLAAPGVAPRRFRECSDLFLEHRLAVNDIWAAFITAPAPFYRLARWLSEGELTALPLGIVPDGFAEYRVGVPSFAVFVEADLGTEVLKRWEKKVAAYLALAANGQFLKVFDRRFFRVLVVAPSPTRLENLRHTILKQTDRMFWLTTREELLTRGLFGTIWQRPADDVRRSLLS